MGKAAAAVRVWCRRLRRRPLLPFLVAATLAADGAVLVAIDGDNPYASGLVAGQLTLLGAWITWSPRGVAARGFLSLAAVVAALGLTGNLRTAPPPAPGPVADQLAGINTAVVLGSLAATTTGAAFARLATRWLARRKRRGAPLVRRGCGIGSLLWSTSLVGAAIAFGRAAEWDTLAYVVVAALVALDSVTAFFVVLASTWPGAWATRVVGVFGTSVAAVAALSALGGEHLPLYYATHAAVASGWLLALEPRRREAAADGSSSTDAADLDVRA